MFNLIYFLAQIVLVSGLFIMLTSDNMLRKLIGLGVLQNAVLIFYIALGKVNGGIAPILREGAYIYANPLPQVLMLTAIVVGFATLAVGLALIYKIAKTYNTINESEMTNIDENNERSN